MLMLSTDSLRALNHNKPTITTSDNYFLLYYATKL